jgi:hypothetical protein
MSSVSIPASASTWWRRSGVPAAVCGSDSLEAEQQPVADLPLRGRRLAARVHLRDRVVESAAAGGSPGKRLARVLALAQERLARPRFRAESGGDYRVCRLQRAGWLLDGFLHMRSTLRCCKTNESCALG